MAIFKGYAGIELGADDLLSGIENDYELSFYILLNMFANMKPRDLVNGNLKDPGFTEHAHHIRSKLSELIEELDAAIRHARSEYYKDSDERSFKLRHLVFDNKDVAGRTTIHCDTQSIPGIMSLYGRCGYPKSYNVTVDGHHVLTDKDGALVGDLPL